MIPSVQWLEARGAERQSAVEKAAAALTEVYRRRYGKMVPPELHRLAALRSGKILYAENLPGGARLVPVHGGFEILVNSGLGTTRTRTAIAHELVHTLFYANTESVPSRLCQPSKREEHFCFDVARRILAPEWLIRSTGIADLVDISEMFFAVSETFKLSRQTASRVLLQDYRLLSGVAAVWLKTSEGWRMKMGNACASPDLTRNDRQQFHKIAKEWLQHKRNFTNVSAVGIVNPAGDTAFVLIARQIRRLAASGTV